MTVKCRSIDKPQESPVFGSQKSLSFRVFINSSLGCVSENVIVIMILHITMKPQVLFSHSTTVPPPIHKHVTVCPLTVLQVAIVFPPILPPSLAMSKCSVHILASTYHFYIMHSELFREMINSRVEPNKLKVKV